MTDRCGFVPPTPGYAPCTRLDGHDGPCAHPFSVSDKELRTLPEEERLAKLKELVTAVNRLAGQEAVHLALKIENYEKQFGISSNDMEMEVATGKRELTLELLNWITTIRRLEHFVDGQVREILKES